MCYPTNELSDVSVAERILIFRIPLNLSKRYLADNSLNKKKERPNRASRRDTSSGERNIKGHMSDGLNFRLLNHKR